MARLARWALLSYLAHPCPACVALACVSCSALPSSHRNQSHTFALPCTALATCLTRPESWPGSPSFTEPVFYRPPHRWVALLVGRPAVAALPGAWAAVHRRGSSHFCWPAATGRQCQWHGHCCCCCWCCRCSGRTRRRCRGGSHPGNSCLGQQQCCGRCRSRWWHQGGCRGSGTHHEAPPAARCRLGLGLSASVG